MEKLRIDVSKEPAEINGEVAYINVLSIGVDNIKSDDDLRDFIASLNSLREWAWPRQSTTNKKIESIDTADGGVMINIKK